MANQALLFVTLALLAAGISCAGPTLGASGTTKDAIPQMKPSEYAKMMAKHTGARPVTSVLAEVPTPPWTFKDPKAWKKAYSEQDELRENLLKQDTPLYQSGKATFPPTQGMCDGSHQSPIDIITSKAEKHPDNKLAFNWFNATGFNWKSADGKSLYLEGSGFEGSKTTFDDLTYKLKRARFISPSEHSINGKQASFEVQFEHESVKRPDGITGPMVVAVHYHWADDLDLVMDDLKEKEDTKKAKDNKQGKPANPVFEKDLDWFDVMKKIKKGTPGTAEIPGRCCQICPLAEKVEDRKPEVVGCKFFQPMELVPPPGKQDYYWYEGSATTPPCTENVLWVVMKKPMFITYEQWKAFSFSGNFRPVQENENKVKFLNGSPPKPGKGANGHAFVEDCGPWHLNCAKDEFYSTR
jgi:carbonic anhydrase